MFRLEVAAVDPQGPHSQGLSACGVEAARLQAYSLCFVIPCLGPFGVGCRVWGLGFRVGVSWSGAAWLLSEPSVSMRSVQLQSFTHCTKGHWSASGMWLLVRSPCTINGWDLHARSTHMRMWQESTADNSI